MGTVRILLCWALLALPAVAGLAQEIDFSGRILVAFDTEPAPGERRADRKDETGWRFVEVVEAGPPADGGEGAAAARATPSETRRWFLVSPPERTASDRSLRAADTPHPWDLAHRIADGTAAAPYGDLLARLRAAEGIGSGVAPAALEPDVRYRERRLPRKAQEAAEERCLPGCVSTTEGSELTLCDERSPHWPRGEGFAWHLEDAFSELRTAREAVGTVEEEGHRVTVAHIDTGYQGDHVGRPRHLDADASLDFTLGDAPVAGGAEDPCNDGLLRFPGHGTFTLGILAGGEVRVASGGFDFAGDFGGAPEARVVSYRVSDSPVHFFPAQLAAAIDTAAETGVDVVSMSMGGLPSGALRDAVNKAYEHGTAVFAAAGNFLKLPLVPVATPTTLVYPARFHRVVAVTGVTADQRTYARVPNAWSFLRGGLSSWSLRGSHGPAFAMREAIAAYTPNVAAPRLSREAANLAEISNGGTSSATPQVAAAAALWLQAHREELETRWHSWEKAEAVMRALFDSAEKNVPDREYSEHYFGQGILKAHRALGQDVAGDLERRPPAKIGLDWIRLLLTVEVPVDGPAAALRLEMLLTEIEQIVYGSKKLQRLLGEGDPEMLSLPEQRKSLRTLARDRRCSNTLRAALAGQVP